MVFAYRLHIQFTTFLFQFIRSRIQERKRYPEIMGVSTSRKNLKVRYDQINQKDW